MKTYTKTTITEAKKLVISFDEFSESPRGNSNLGYFLSRERDYKSPDGKDNPLYSIMINTADEAENTEDHIRLIKAEAKKQGINIEYIYPVNRYEHGNIVYSLGEIHNFDYSNCGFYIITDKSRKEIGVRKDKKSIERFIKNELKDYNTYVNGEVYRFKLYNDNGEVEDSCGGFYDLESIREYLPKEWAGEDLEDYFVNNF